MSFVTNYRPINLHLFQHLLGTLQITTLFRKNCSLFELLLSLEQELQLLLLARLAMFGWCWSLHK